MTTSVSAISDLGKQANLGKDPRAQYWTQAYSNEYWSNRLEDVRQAKYDSNSFSYSAKTFESAQDQLVKEIKWVRETYGYYAKLAKPYEASGLQTWAKMTAVADSIDKSLEVPNAQKVAANVMTITRAAAELVGEFPGVGKAVSVAMASFDLAAEIAEVGAGRVSTTTTAPRWQSSVRRPPTGSMRRPPQWARHSRGSWCRTTRNSSGSGSARGPRMPVQDVNDWLITPEGLKETSEQFRTSMSVMFYQSLMPAKYRAFYHGRQSAQAGEQCNLRHEPQRHRQRLQAVEGRAGAGLGADPSVRVEPRQRRGSVQRRGLRRDEERLRALQRVVVSVRRVSGTAVR
jgi:hypothetical protein